MIAVRVRVVEVETVTGTGDVEDHGFASPGQSGGGLFIAGFALHDGDAVEEELGEVGHGDGAFARDAVVGDLVQEVAEEEVYARGGGEIIGTGEEFRGEEFGATAGR